MKYEVLQVRIINHKEFGKSPLLTAKESKDGGKFEIFFKKNSLSCHLKPKKNPGNSEADDIIINGPTTKELTGPRTKRQRKYYIFYSGGPRTFP